MTWQDKTAQERDALKTRRVRRRARKRQFTVQLWTDKDGNARQPVDQAALAYDLCRRLIKNIRGGSARDAAYKDLAVVLVRHAQTLPGADKILSLIAVGESRP